jgi:SlyX protein
MRSRQEPPRPIKQAMSEARITDLEMLAAHQAQALDDLSAMVAEQWKVIDAMRKKLDEMSERFQAVEENALGRPENAKPPHW